MNRIRADFDGHVFVPREKVDLPAGASVDIVIASCPLEPTREQQRQWKDILNELNSTEPVFASVDDALRYSRKRP